jgi:NTE family protein
MRKRALIVAGGGGKGAWAVGFLKALDRQYHYLSGISTGALIVPLAARRAWSRLEAAYTGVSNEQIWNLCPFNSDGSIKKVNALKRLLQGKSSLGEMQKLQDLIKTFFIYDDYHTLQQNDIEVEVHALNLSWDPAFLESFSNLNTPYEMFKQAMYASCCFAPATNMANIYGDWFVDGGWVETITVNNALEKGYKDIDVITLRPELTRKRVPYPKNMFLVGERIGKAVRHDSVYENLDAALKLAAKCPGVNINVYNIPNALTSNAMNFDRQQMQEWFKMGYEEGLAVRQKAA